jgi:hypothetical protein
MRREGFDSSLRLSVSAAEFGRGQQVSLVVVRGPERGAKEGDVNVVWYEGAATKQPNGGSWISAEQRFLDINPRLEKCDMQKQSKIYSFTADLPAPLRDSTGGGGADISSNSRNKSHQ